MATKTMLVCLTTPAHAETLLKFAVPLARKHNAHLTAIHTLVSVLVYPGVAMHVPVDTYSALQENQKEQAEKIKAVFEKHTANEDFTSEFRLTRADSVSMSDRMIESARAADLVLMAHEEPGEDRYDQRHAQEAVIRASGRPVIIIPHEYDGPVVGKNVVLGWSDTREAARAAHDLLQVADTDATLTIVRAGPKAGSPMADSDAIDIAEVFARHGLQTTLEHRDLNGHSIADILSEVAFEKGADMIVTGAFGHSKTYDFVIGATSHALLRDAKLPVMFSK